MHFSAGAVIRKDGKCLLIDRFIEPFGFAGVAGHIDENETPEQALIREVEEESGLLIKSKKLLLEEELDWNRCSKGVGTHYWYLFECGVEGELKKSEREAKSIGWFDAEEIKSLKLEPVWEYWFKKLSVV